MSNGSSGGGNNGGRMCPQGIETRVRLDNQVTNLKRVETTLMDTCKRLDDIEDTVNALSYRIGTWAAIGMVVGGVAIQAFTKYVLNW